MPWPVDPLVTLLQQLARENRSDPGLELVPDGLEEGGVDRVAPIGDPLQDAVQLPVEADGGSWLLMAVAIAICLELVLYVFCV